MPSRFNDHCDEKAIQWDFCFLLLECQSLTIRSAFMPKTEKRRTLRDVAHAAGVSEMTVSRVLRDTGVVSARTKARVLGVVEDLGYVQNQLAGSLAQSRSNQVAVIIPSLVNNVFTEVMSGISNELDKAGYNAVVGVSNYDLKKEEDLIYSMMSWRPAAVIVTNIHHTDRTRNILSNSGIPVVEIMNLTRTPIDMVVGLDHAKAGRLLADHLLSKGYRKFGIVGWNEQDLSAFARFSAIKERVSAHGFDMFAPELFDRPPDFVGGKIGLRTLLEIAPDLEAVFFSNDTAAIGGMMQCYEAGISIPDDLAITGFSGLEIGQNMPLKLTTVSTNRLETGRVAARSVLNRLFGITPPTIRDMGFQLIDGDTA